MQNNYWVQNSVKMPKFKMCTTSEFFLEIIFIHAAPSFMRNWALCHVSTIIKIIKLWDVLRLRVSKQTQNSNIIAAKSYFSIALLSPNKQWNACASSLQDFCEPRDPILQFYKDQCPTWYLLYKDPHPTWFLFHGLEVCCHSEERVQRWPSLVVRGEYFVFCKKALT